MSEELLSAMLDGQCTPAELEQVLAALAQSPESKARYSRMVLARELLAGTRVRKPAPDFALSVMAAIDADDAQTESFNPKVVPLRRVAASPAVSAPTVVVPVPKRARRWQPVVGLAAAASLTAAVVIAGGNFLTRPASVSSPVAKVQPVQDLASAASELASSNGGVKETRWSQIDSAAARQLNDFLMEHSNSRSESGMGGALSYARLAVRTADYRQAEEPR